MIRGSEWGRAGWANRVRCDFNSNDLGCGRYDATADDACGLAENAWTDSIWIAPARCVKRE